MQARDVPVRMTLADFLRHELGLTGTHLGCEHGVCGACTVLLDDRSARSCLTLAVQADGARVTTVEGLARKRRPECPSAGVHRPPRAPVRLLHARDAYHPDRIAARPPEPERSRCAPRHLRQSVPLHRVFRNRSCRPCGREGLAGAGTVTVPGLLEAPPSLQLSRVGREVSLGARASCPHGQWWACGPLRARCPRSQG